LLEISAWQLGDGTQVIVSGVGSKCGEYYLSSHGNTYNGVNGWNKMHYAFTFNKACNAADSTTVTFFLWNPTQNPTFIDDLKFSIKKFGYNYLEY
jgi:hypothetical protein